MVNHASPAPPVPPWADSDLSQRIFDLAAGGESQDLELKERFPEQARDLGKEIAAFATSNSGTILLGIAKSGELLGLPNCETAFGRESLLDRIAGICAKTVKPSITPSFRFARSEDQIVLAIDVPKGDAPLYYVGGVPYLRQMTTARPAEPDEVINHVLEWDRARKLSDEPSPEGAFLSRVATLLVDVLVHAGELEERQVNPWFDELRHTLAWAADEARDLAARAPSELSEIATPLEQLASDLDRAAYERLTMGAGWDETEAATTAAIDRARDIRQRWIDPDEFSEESIAGLRETVLATARKLASLAARLEEMDDQNRLGEIQSTAGELGLVLLKAATFGTGLGDEGRVGELTAIGRMLRDIETRTIYVDGGQSAQKVLDDVREASAQLSAWVPDFQAHPKT